MKRLFLLAALLTSPMLACQPAQSDKTEGASVDTVIETIGAEEKAAAVKAGVVRLRLKAPVSEQFCLYHSHSTRKRIRGEHQCDYDWV